MRKQLENNVAENMDDFNQDRYTNNYLNLGWKQTSNNQLEVSVLVSSKPYTKEEIKGKIFTMSLREEDKVLLEDKTKVLKELDVLSTRQGEFNNEYRKINTAQLGNVLKNAKKSKATDELSSKDYTNIVFTGIKVKDLSLSRQSLELQPVVGGGNLEAYNSIFG